MILIDNEIITLVKELKVISKYIDLVVDQQKEIEYANRKQDLYSRLEQVSNKSLSDKETNDIIEFVNDKTSELYIYTYEEILNTLYDGEQWELFRTSVHWIESHKQINFLLLNGILTYRAYSPFVDNLNNNYIVSKIEL